MSLNKCGGGEGEERRKGGEKGDRRGRLFCLFNTHTHNACRFTAVKAFSKLVSETNDLAGQRELIAEYLQVDVMEPLKVLARDIAAERRKHLNEGAELLRQLRVSMETLERVKKKGEKEGRKGGWEGREGKNEERKERKGKEREKERSGKEGI